MSVSVYIDGQPAIASGLANGLDWPKAVATGRDFE